MIDREQKLQIIEKYNKHSKDTGSAEVQIALLTGRIHELNRHFQSNVKDHHSRRGLLKLVGKRRSLLDYLKRKRLGSYKELIQSLKIRK